MNCTRPDITDTVSKLNKYTSNPNDDHWTALLQLVSYVSRTREYALKYKKYPLVLEGYNMLIELQILMKRNQLVDMFLLLKVQRYLENLQINIYYPFYNRIKIYSLK